MIKAKKAKILLINLDRSADRLTKSRALLDSYEADYCRISAVDGQELTSQTINEAVAPDYNSYYKVLTTNEIGCYMSHQRCWEHIINNDLDYAIILEDDFSLNGDISRVGDYLDAIDTPWDCIKLMEYPEKRKEIQQTPCLDKRLVRYDKVPIRTCAYALSKEGASKMMQHNKKIGRPVDVDFQYWWESDLRVYGLKPYIVGVNDNVVSTIDQGENRKSSKKSVFKKFIQQLNFMYYNKKYTKRLVRNSN